MVLSNRAFSSNRATTLQGWFTNASQFHSHPEWRHFSEVRGLRSWELDRPDDFPSHAPKAFGEAPNYPEPGCVRLNSR
jgi:hypothetical protein